MGSHLRVMWLYIHIIDGNFSFYPRSREAFDAKYFETEHKKISTFDLPFISFHEGVKGSKDDSNGCWLLRALCCANSPGRHCRNRMRLLMYTKKSCHNCHLSLVFEPSSKYTSICNDKLRLSKGIQKNITWCHLLQEEKLMKRQLYNLNNSSSFTLRAMTDKGAILK